MYSRWYCDSILRLKIAFKGTNFLLNKNPVKFELMLDSFKYTQMNSKATLVVFPILYAFCFGVNHWKKRRILENTIGRTLDSGDNGLVYLVSCFVHFILFKLMIFSF